MKNQNKIKNEGFRRYEKIKIDANASDKENRTVSAAISSEQQIQRWYGTEKLLHTDKAINMERAADGLPLLFNHDRDKLIGRANNIRLEDKILRADITFSENPFADQIFKDMQGGFIRDVSVSGSIDKYKDIKGGIEVTRWTPQEISIATVAADHTVGINRNEEKTEGLNMKIDGKEIAGDVSKKYDRSIAEGMKREQERANSIRDLFSGFSDNPQSMDLMERCLSDHRITIETARSELLTILGQGFTPTAKVQKTQHASVGTEDNDKFARSCEQAILVNTGIETDEKIVDSVHSGDLASYSIRDMARAVLNRQNISLRGIDQRGLAAAAFTRNVGGHSSSDFPAILENVSNKTMAKGYAETETTWKKWAGIISVNDFKTNNMITMSEFSDLEVKPEGGEFQYGTLKDKKEMIAIQTLAKGFSITREALINDDMGQLVKAPKEMGKAAARALNEMAYAMLTSNPALNEDGKSVFHADHNNIGTPGAIAEATLDEMRVLIRTQKGLLHSAGKTKNKKSSATLNIRAKHLIVPVALGGEARRVIAREYSANDLSQINIIRNMFDVIEDGLMDDVSATAYYMLANQNATDTVNMAFLNGRQAPYLESEKGWNIQGIDYHVYIDAGAAWGDFRGAAYNAGA